MKKNIKIGIGLLSMISSFLLGMMFQKEPLIEKETLDLRSDVETIAIVNMDDGVKQEGKSINYGNELMPKDETYIVTGLNEAREGVKNGIYAAYISVPENFSKAVESINKIPVMAVISYELNEQLSVKNKESIVSQIQAFEKEIKYQVGYLYLTSVLTEFHTGQQAAKQVLINDEKNQQAITNIGGLDLTVLLEIPPLERVENRNVALSLDQENVQKEQIMDTVMTSLEVTKEEVLTKFNAIANHIDTYILQAEKFDVFTNTTGISVYDIDSMDAYLTINNAQPNDLTMYLSKVIDESIQQTVSEITTLWQVKQQEWIVNAVSDTSEIVILNTYNLDEIKTLIMNLRSSDVVEAKNSLSTLETIFADSTLIDTIEYEELIPSFEDFELVTKTMGKEELTKNIFETAVVRNTEELKDGLYKSEESIVTTIMNQIKENQERQKINLFTNEKQNVINAVETFDVDGIWSRQNGKLENSDNSLGTLMNGIKEKVSKQEVSYLEYILERETKIENYSEELIGQVQKNKDASDEQLLITLETAKQTVTHSGVENLEMLQSFISKLEYSKHGKNQNKEVKDHILEPTTILMNGVVNENREIEKTVTFLEENGLLLTNVTVGIVLLSAIAYTVYTKRSRWN